MTKAELIKRIEELSETFCDYYCKKPEEYAWLYEDSCEAQDIMREEECALCPFNEIVNLL